MISDLRGLPVRDSTHTLVRVYMHDRGGRWHYDGDDRFGMEFSIRRAMGHFSNDLGRPASFVLVAWGWEGFGLAMHFRATPE